MSMHDEETIRDLVESIGAEMQEVGHRLMPKLLELSHQAENGTLSLKDYCLLDYLVNGNDLPCLPTIIGFMAGKNEEMKLWLKKYGEQHPEFEDGDVQGKDGPSGV